MTKNELMELEREFWSNTDDPKFFADHMIDGALAVTGDYVETKERAVKSTGESGEKWTNFKMEDARVVPIGDCGRSAARLVRTRLLARDAQRRRLWGDRRCATNCTGPRSRDSPWPSVGLRHRGRRGG